MKLEARDGSKWWQWEQGGRGWLTGGWSYLRLTRIKVEHSGKLQKWINATHWQMHSITWMEGWFWQIWIRLWNKDKHCTHHGLSETRNNISIISSVNSCGSSPMSYRLFHILGVRQGTREELDQIWTCEVVKKYYRMRLNFSGTKLSRIANLLNFRGFYFCGCWERIDMVDHLVLGKLCN